MLRRLGVRGKVLAALAVPVVVLFGAASLISVQSIRSAQVARAVSGFVGTIDETRDFVRTMQVERQAGLAFVADPAAPRDELYAARAATDVASARVAIVIDAVDIKPLGPRFAESLQVTSDARKAVPTLPARSDVTGRLSPAVVDAQYSEIINLHVEQARVLANVLTDRELATYLNAYGIVAEAGEKEAHELPFAVKAVQTRGADPRAVSDLASEVASNTVARAEARTAVDQLRRTGVQLPAMDPAYVVQRSVLASGDANAIATIDLASFQTHATAERTELAAVNERVRVLAVALAARSAVTTTRDTNLTIAGTVVAVLFSIFIALLIARQITVPLRRLTKAVGDVREQLPLLVEQVSVPGEAPQLALVQIPVTSGDEIGRLATAFNDVNATTVQVAQEQAALRGSIAEMFVNVARRDQVLLNRQISFIDALEQTEEDPGVLANLFRLDHLATRMRRNAESLLVLAGIDSGRRIRDAMPFSDVIRTASSEIEQYDRIRLELSADPHMLGFHSLAAAHLLAELLENATVFSEPETPVEVETSTDGEYVQVVVRDQGLGMSDDEIESAQVKIRSTTAGDMLGAQRLGFYVVGRLAARLDAQVTLAKSINGTIAVVRFPASLFEVSDASLSAPPESRPAPVEPEPPVAVLVDVEAMTDGATSLGLPRRPSHNDDREVLVGGSRAEEESKIVLPPLAEVTLTPELTAALGAWAPEMPASDVASGLPSRAAAPSSGRQEPEVEKSATQPVPATESAGVRGAITAGFRGRAVDAPPVFDLRPLDLRTVAGGHGGTEATASRARDTSADVVPDVAPEPELVIPGLEPDEDSWELDAYGVDEPAEPAYGGYSPPSEAYQEPAYEQPAYESTLNEARAWGEEELTAASWQPAPAVAQPVTREPLQVAAEPVPPAVPEPSQPVPVAVPVWTPTAPDQWAHTIVRTAESVAPAPVAESAESTSAVEPRPGWRALRGWRGRKPAGSVVDAPPDPEAADEPVPGSVQGVEPADVVEPAEATEAVEDALAVPVVEAGTSSRRDRRWRLGRKSAVPVAEVVEPTLVVEPVPVAEVVEPALVAASMAAAGDAGSSGRRVHFRWLGRKSATPALPAVATPSEVVDLPADAVLPLRPSAWETGRRAHGDEHHAADGRRAAAKPAVSQWTPQGGFSEPEAVTPSSFTPAPTWSAMHPAAPASGESTDGTGVPSVSVSPAVANSITATGVMDAGIASMLALRFDIQEQAFAELGQLAAYRPTAVGTDGSGSSTLTRRIPNEIPAEVPDVTRPSNRDAEQLRARLASFRAGTDRGRLAAEQSGDGAAANGAEPPVDHGLQDHSDDAGSVITRTRAAATGGPHKEEE